MVDQSSNSLDEIFRALADPTRRQMLDALRSGDRTIGQLAAPFDMSLAGAAKHVQVLARAKLITRRKQGRAHVCTLDHAALAAAHRWLETYSEFWNSRLDKLEELLAQEKKGKSK